MAISELRKPRYGSTSLTSQLDRSAAFVKFEEWSTKPIVNEDEWHYIPTVRTSNVLITKAYDLSDDIFYGNPPISTVEGKFFVDDRISNIYETIIESYALSKFTEDWDGDGAIGFNELIFERAITILIKYADYLLNTFDTCILSPEINLARDGSIDLEWRIEKNILLINVLNTDELHVQYYGHNMITDTIIKGTLKSFDINESLCFWMKCLI